jgi:hemerythrin
MINEIDLKRMKTKHKTIKAGDAESLILLDVQEKVVNWLIEHIAKIDPFS